jgi:dTDP-6-deoxy-L-talose 4-dehydrogenase (NAD+)
MSQGNKMKVLVTGATGFIGNYVVQELLNQEQWVIATSRDAEKARSYDWFSQVQYIPCDLNVVQGSLFDFFHQPELLIHLAWDGLPNYKELFHFEKNLFESYFFIKKMIEGGLRHFSVIGTCLEYGMKEGCLTEDMSTAPCTSYGLAKDTLRKFIEVLAKKYCFDWKWIRLFYLYGEGQSKNSILEQLKSEIAKGKTVFPMSGGEQQRDYLPVERAAEYIVRISTQTKQQGIFNCCSGNPITIRSLVEEYLRKTGQSIKLDFGRYPYSDYEPMVFWGDNKKLKKILKNKNESTD